MKGFVLFAAMLVAALIASMAADSAKAHGGGVVVARDRFGRAVVVDRGFHGGGVRSFNGGGARVVEVRRGFFGGVRSVRVR